MNDLPIVQIAAEEVRTHFERVARREGFSPDLHGLCARASVVLRDALREGGLAASFILGQRGGERHCWVLSGDYIVDVTATQFGRDFPPVYIVPEEDAIDYEGWVEDDEAMDLLKGWPTHQQPQPEDS